MILKLHPKTKKITIELPDDLVDKDLRIEITPNKRLDELGGSLKIPKEKINYELEKKGWEEAVKEKYDKN